MTVNSLSPPVVASLGSGEFELILVGGGLQNCLIAKSVLSVRPQTRLLLAESADRLAGDHTWCFHSQDLPASVESACQDFVERRWDSYEVLFPGYRRRLESKYAMMTSAAVRRGVEAAFRASPNATLMLGSEVQTVEPGLIETREGQRLKAPLIIDSRGPSTVSQDQVPNGNRAFQKFFGLEIEVSTAHQLAEPLLMDATVQQRDGFRFFYLLPLSPTRLLVEDTYYSVHDGLDKASLEQRVLDYAESSGMRVERILRRESGVLPLPVGRMPGQPASRSSQGLLVGGGYAGGWFHPTTGYSTPAAARLAEYLMKTEISRVTVDELNAVRGRIRKQASFAVWLNRLMFRAFEADRRYSPLEHFYELPAETIERFYALKMAPRDRFRLFCGKPPRGFSASRLLLKTVFPSRNRDNLGLSS